jgi:hypothetical protein
MAITSPFNGLEDSLIFVAEQRGRESTQCMNIYFKSATKKIITNASCPGAMAQGTASASGTQAPGIRFL